MRENYRVERWTKTDELPEAASLKSVMEREGYSVFQWSDRPGTVYDTHLHGEDQSHWIISGALELTIEGAGVFVLEAGDRDFMPAGTRHSARVMGGDPAVYLIGAKDR